MTSLATDANNDIFMGPDHNLALVRDLAAVVQDCKNAVEAQLGEMPLARDRGVPTMETIWSDYKPKQFEAAARAILLTVPNVTGVKSFNIAQVGDQARYEAAIISTFGPATVAGNLTS